MSSILSLATPVKSMKTWCNAVAPGANLLSSVAHNGICSIGVAVARLES
ncbi:hypothetical protein CCACVL1_02320 [Corchorus capsularis]|uniref:Uncharacterized protein n=1 Tax=Corchorus capsularis TaxID=210143 RepID=A0A1R3K9A3_COCAP|nr:hypothetical protein CCACVL1_02320 [Corchorus capsularis]